METEKVCVNLSAAELGQLDLLVANGVYVSRTDAVRAALRREFGQHPDVIGRHVSASQARITRGSAGIGYFVITRSQLEDALANGERTEVFCAGIVVIAKDVDADLADRAIARLRVFGSLRGPADVLDRLADRTERGIV